LYKEALPIIHHIYDMIDGHKHFQEYSILFYGVDGNEEYIKQIVVFPFEENQPNERLHEAIVRGFEDPFASILQSSVKMEFAVFLSYGYQFQPSFELSHSIFLFLFGEVKIEPQSSRHLLD